MMQQRAVKLIIAVLTILSWMTFLYLDTQWNAVLSRAVAEGNKTYGELYGPLSFFRPVSLYSALILSLVSVGLLMCSRKKK